ncbi:PIN domain-containing protein [Salipiger mangrovisoli]|uniref:Ribonuclease VapC n=1 Tax=Salipiger mangrovisoli TaxID=2865933 RepID=A0ABR9X0G3_9RHOB|nr:PIN domain-containing protein [Salipiger mangrovisoli]MBE9637043.1 PIN domain-containing protein [Salipiger mangrovisoli]
MSRAFFDTNVILYLLGEGPKADRAEALLLQGGVISVQVLNEALVNCLRKARLSPQEAGDFLAGVRALCETVPLTTETHDIGRALGARYGFSVYDSMIVAAALRSGCDTLWTEDMHHGLLVESSLRLLNPFAS